MSIKKYLKSFWAWLKAEIVAEVSDNVDIDGDGPEMPPADDVEYDSLHWRYGGFSGESAERVDGVRIVLDSVSSGGLRYHYAIGDLRTISAQNSHENPNCVTCLFCLIDGVWCGGKFDWISSDRLTRDFHNISTGYHGWPADAISRAEGFAFVIVSKDGKRRTNISILEKVI